MKKLLLMFTLLMLATPASANFSGATGAGNDAGGAGNTAMTVAPHVSFDDQPAIKVGDVLLAKPNDYMLDMMSSIIGGQAMSYVFSNNTNGAGGKLFDGYTVKEGTPNTTVFSHILGVLLKGVIACAAILITWSYLLTSTSTAQDGEFLGKKGDSSFLPFRTGLSVVSVAPIQAFGGLSLMQYIVVCAMSLGVIFAGYMSSAVINYTIDQSMNEMSSKLEPQNVAPLVRKVLDVEAKCYFLSQDPINKTKFDLTLPPIMSHGDKQRTQTTVDRSTNVYTLTTDVCAIDYQRWYGAFLSSMVNAFAPEKMATFQSEFERSSPNDTSKGIQKYDQISNVDDFIATLKTEAGKSNRVLKENLHQLMDIIAEDENFIAFRASMLHQLKARYDSLAGDVNQERKDEDLAQMAADDVALFDAAVVSITDKFNKDFLQEYHTPEYLKNYSERLKETLNSEGFATLGGTVFGLLGISTAVNNAAVEGLPQLVRNKSFAEFGIDGNQEVIKNWQKYKAYYSSLFRGSAYPTAALSNKKSNEVLAGSSLDEMSSDVDKFFDGTWLLRALGFNKDAILEGKPVLFELRDIGDRALVYATGLSVARAALTGLGKAEEQSVAPTPWIAFKLAIIENAVAGLNGLIPYLFILGFVLAFVLPALPWFFWVTAIVGLIIFFAEALIAINIWAIALAHPDGEGPTSNASSQGLQLLIRLVFQPSIMVAAFAFAMVAVDVVARYITTFTFSVLVGSMDSIFQFVGIATLYLIILIASAWTIYGVLSQMSSQVFSWIGQASHDMGEAKGEQNFMAAMNSTKHVSHAANSAGQANKNNKKGAKADE